MGDRNQILQHCFHKSRHIQLRERLSCIRGKVNATMSEVIMGNGGFYGRLSDPQGVSSW